MRQRSEDSDAILRRKAKANLKGGDLLDDVTSEEDAKRLIHELRTHQIELEIQNEELRKAQAQLEESRTQYSDLYDFAPVGYLTFDKNGLILLANLAVASLLNTERARLIKSIFHSYVLDQDREKSRLHISRIFKTKERQTCNLRLRVKGGAEFYARLESIFVESGNGVGMCRTSILDVSCAKIAEDALRCAHDRLEKRVEERTAELVRSNELLSREIIAHGQTEENLRRREDDYKVLSGRLLKTQEEERKRIARDLHDCTGSTLTAIKMKIEFLLSQMNFRDSAYASLEALVPVIQIAIDENRRIMSDLRPSILDDLGLLPAVGWLCREHAITHPKIEIEQIIRLEEKDIPEPLKIVIFRIIQESFSNIGKYSRARRVKLSIRRTETEIEMTIKDDGVGFDLDSVRSRDSQEKGMGLTSIKERAELSGGVSVIESVPGEGTTVKGVWPLVASKIQSDE